VTSQKPKLISVKGKRREKGKEVRKGRKGKGGKRNRKWEGHCEVQKQSDTFKP